MQVIPIRAWLAEPGSRDAMYTTAYLTDVTDEAVLGDFWPGIQLYYPPVKFAPALGVYEDLDQAAARLRKHAHNTQAHTLLFDLEDG
jgi:hypothetical protein